MRTTLEEVYDAYSTNYEALVVLSLNLVSLRNAKPAILAGCEFNSCSATEAEEKLQSALSELDLLIIVGLYAVFEQALMDQWEDEVSRIPRDRAERQSFQSLLEARIAQRIRPQDASDHMKFYLPRVGQQVYSGANDVRLLRNWIAHGRKGKKPNNLKPKQAYTALSEFLVSAAPAVL